MKDEKIIQVNCHTGVLFRGHVATTFSTHKDKTLVMTHAPMGVFIEYTKNGKKTKGLITYANIVSIEYDTDVKSEGKK